MIPPAYSVCDANANEEFALEMGVGLPRSACGSRSQTAGCCCGTMAVVVSDFGKGIPRGCQVSIKEMSAS